MGESCCILIITVVPGTRYIDLQSISEFNSESEVLLPPGGELIFTGNDLRDIMYPQWRKQLKVLYVTYVPPKSIHIEMQKRGKTDRSLYNSTNKGVNCKCVNHINGDEELDLYDTIEEIAEALERRHLTVVGTISKRQPKLYSQKS